MIKYRPSQKLMNHFALSGQTRREKLKRAVSHRVAHAMFSPIAVEWTQDLTCPALNEQLWTAISDQPQISSTDILHGGAGLDLVTQERRGFVWTCSDILGQPRTFGDFPGLSTGDLFGYRLDVWVTDLSADMRKACL
ncbi:hypothetical protein RRG08_055058 [Elysia crispata]|uniref:Uncharacterized protein n=1 Tax=Elysia crispata TaxID=231223 RepID=A0AAE1AZX1_9GAST|nr:hypothetical protein RRG08_055058 [Elysia crispata]